MITVLVLGATGFIGSAVTGVLAARSDVRLARGHRGRLGTAAGPIVDVRDEGTLDCLAEADVVVHAAHLVQGTEAELEATNVDGSRRVADRCQRHGTRLVSISTAAVYGAGPWRGEDVQRLTPRPASQVSCSRARGDDAVLETGGLVVRPHLVHGPGDQWFVPAARRILRTTGWVDGGSSLHSSIQVDDLARGVVDAALGDASGVRLLTDPPRTLPEILSPYLAPTDVAASGTTHELARRHPTGAGDPRWQHHVDHMALDHHLVDSGRR
jgi:nucleoside-diphosphate-sugar epimerase